MEPRFCIYLLLKSSLLKTIANEAMSNIRTVISINAEPAVRTGPFLCVCVCVCVDCGGDVDG